MARPSERFPTNPILRVVRIAERSMPDPYRPRLSEELEKKLEPIERESARCYAEAEELTFQLRDVTRELETRRTGEFPPVRLNR